MVVVVVRRQLGARLGVLLGPARGRGGGVGCREVGAAMGMVSKGGRGGRANQRHWLASVPGF